MSDEPILKSKPGYGGTRNFSWAQLALDPTVVQHEEWRKACRAILRALEDAHYLKLPKEANR